MSPGATAALATPPKKRRPPRGRFDPLLNSCFPLIRDQALNLLAEMPRSNAWLRDSRAEGNMKGRSFVSRGFFVLVFFCCFFFKSLRGGAGKRRSREPRAPSAPGKNLPGFQNPGFQKLPASFSGPANSSHPQGTSTGKGFPPGDGLLIKKSGRKRIKWSQTPWRPQKCISSHGRT